MVDDRQKKKVHRYECKAIVVTHFSFVLDFKFVFYLFVVDLFVVQFYFVRCIIILFLLRKNLKWWRRRAVHRAISRAMIFTYFARSKARSIHHVASRNKK